MQEALEEFSSRWSEMQSQLLGIFQGISDQLAPIRDYIQSDAFREALTTFHEAMQALPEWSRVVQTSLARSGWFLGDNVTPAFMLEAYELVETEQTDALESLMAEYVSGEVDEIEGRAKRYWPERSSILGAAFNAHRQEQYALSIPVLLAQVDGIAFDVLGFKRRMSFYGKYNKQPQTRAFYQTALAKYGADSMEAAFLLKPLEVLSCLAYDSEDWKRAVETDPTMGTLNRHAVLHGEDTGYDTLNNSLRAILLLDYLCSLKRAKVTGPQEPQQHPSVGI